MKKCLVSSKYVIICLILIALTACTQIADNPNDYDKDSTFSELTATISDTSVPLPVEIFEPETTTSPETTEAPPETLARETLAILTMCGFYDEDSPNFGFYAEAHNAWRTV